MTERVFICQVCHHTLNLLADEKGATYFHTMQDDTGDHEPVPVLATSDWAPRCDFCNVDEVAFRLPVRDFEMPMLPGMDQYDSNGAWAACTTCAKLIDTNRWSALLRRVADSYEGRHGAPMEDLTRTALAAMYRRLRKNISGPLAPVP